jgi:long-chain acyl-CoA synthetase
MRSPFDLSGVRRDGNGPAVYAERPASLVELLRRSVERDPAAAAIVDLAGETVTYEELWERALRVASGLGARGLASGDRVAIALPNGLDWVLAFWGIQLLGAVTVPVNIRLTDEEVAWVLEHAEAKHVFRPGEKLPDGPPVPPAEPAPDDLAAIFYTSGTTGRPKGAMTTHTNFATNSENAFRLLGIPRSEGPAVSTLVSVPLFHVTGCNSQMIPVLELGGRVEILPKALDLELFLDAVSEHRITHLVSVPAVYFALINSPRFAGADVTSVRWALYGGAPITDTMVWRIKDEFPSAQVGNGFGLTETSSLTSFLPDAESLEHPDSVGYPMPVVDLRLDAPDPDTGVGELLVRGPNVVAGYWRAPEATAATFVEGWLRTGDLARIDPDGRLYIVDRSKDMINRGGENVYSVEVENALAAAPGVGEAAVVGVADEMMGEKVGAVLVPLGGERIVVADVLADLRERIADFKVPQYVSVREDPLPRNPGGKVVKAELAAAVDWGPPLW